MAVFTQGIKVIIGADATGFNKAMGQMEGTVKKTRAGLNRAAKVGAAVAAGIGAASIKMAMTFDKKFAEVAGIAKRSLGATEDDIKRFEMELKALSERTGVPLITLTEGLYQSISRIGELAADSTDPVETLMGIMRDATTASIVGFASQEVVLTGLMNTLNAFSMRAEDSGHVLDVMTRSVDLGAMRMDEFANSMAFVSTIAAESGVSFEEMSAAMVTMTRVGMPANMAARSLRMVIASMLKPSTEAEEITEKLGIAWDKTALKEKGLVGMFESVSDALESGNVQMEDLTPNVRGLLGALVLAKNKGEDFRKVSEAMADATGVNAAALGSLNQKEFRQYEIAINSMKLAMQDLGETLLPPFVELVKYLTSDVVPALGKVTGFIVGIKEALDAFKETPSEAGARIAKAGGGGAEQSLAMAQAQAATATSGKVRKAAGARAESLAEQAAYMRALRESQRAGFWQKMPSAADRKEEEAIRAKGMNWDKLAKSYLSVRDLLQMLGGERLPKGHKEREWLVDQWRKENRIFRPPGWQRGGLVPGLGAGDTVPAMLSPGEYVINRRSAALFAPLLRSINQQQAGAAGAMAASSMGGNTFIFKAPVDRHTIRGLLIPEAERAERLKRTKGRSTILPRRW